MTVEEALAFLDTFLNQEPLSDVQELVFREVWEGRSYQEIAEHSSYNEQYIKHIGSQLWQLLSKVLGEKVTKGNFRSVLRRRFQQAQEGAGLQPSPFFLNSVATELAAPLGTAAGEQGNTSPIPNRTDWGDAIDVSVFFGRKAELATLQQWIVQDRCRLVVLLGMGGIGKTALAVKLAQQVQNEFEYLIWRSLRNAPPVLDILAELIEFLSNQQETDLPQTLDGRILRLMQYLIVFLLGQLLKKN